MTQDDARFYVDMTETRTAWQSFRSHAKHPARSVDALLADIPKLTKILTYYVVAGNVTSDE